MEDVWRVRNVVEGSDDGGGNTCEMGTKSIIFPIEVVWWKEGFLLYVIVDWERLASDLLKCGKCGVRDKPRVVVSVVGMWLFSWSGDDLLDEMSMILVQAIFLSGFLVEEEAFETILGGQCTSLLFLAKVREEMTETLEHTIGLLLLLRCSGNWWKLVTILNGIGSEVVNRVDFFLILRLRLSEVEGFLIDKIEEHVDKASIGVIFVSREANDIFT
ncbi:hypothetical protein Tco_0787555 [Tanacetum coccineum]